MLFRIGALALATLSLLVAGCGSLPASAARPGIVRVVAGENFWGSIASQLGGNRASVQSIVVNPAQDPHAYEPNASDARTLASAQLAIVNGVGYDPWMTKLLAANPTSGRIVLNVGDTFGLKEGDNPHRWYDPADVEAVASSITAGLTRLDPRDKAYFARLRTQFESSGLARYHAVIAAIRAHYAGTPVGASESIFALLSPALGLRLITPPGFMRSTSEGTDVSAQDTIATERQISSHQIKVWIYNSQNTTPEIQRLGALARAAGIPITTVTETLSPPNVSFEQWQASQLTGLEQALARARR